MNLEITIRFFDYWHCGSGESGGNESDSLVVKYDEGVRKGLPYVPAKTLKGLIREMVEICAEDVNITDITCVELQKWFGNTADKENHCYGKYEVPDNETQTYLGNANIIDNIEKNNISGLFKNFKNTKLEKGIAKDSTLREIQTVIPLTLNTTFLNVDINSTQYILLKNAIESIKRIGLNRNRGMGRCEIKVEEIQS